MDDQSALIQDYEITIDSMRREIQTLREKLEEPAPVSSAQEEFDRCEELIEINRQEIEGNTADIAEEKRKQRVLKAEEEWIKSNSPEFQQSRELEARIQEMTQKILSIKKQELETSSNLSLEQLKRTNPKLHQHVVRALRVEKQHLDLKEDLLRMKEEKKELQLQYYRITQAFAGEEKTKQKLKETEKIVEVKGKYVAELTKQLSDIQQKLQTAKANMHNVELKKLLMEYNDVKARKERLAGGNAGIEQEIAMVEENTEKLEKNPEKITPSAANTNLRKEIKGLEAQVIESSRQLKEKEKEKFQAEFNYEEACKQLKELQKPIEIVTRNSLSRRVSIKEGSSLISPTSPAKRFNDSRGLSPDKLASRKSVVIVEQATSPEKRASIVNMIGRGMTETLTEQLARALKGVGKPGQGIASKLLSVNRGNIIAKAK